MRPPRRNHVAPGRRFGSSKRCRILLSEGVDMPSTQIVHQLSASMSALRGWVAWLLARPSNLDRPARIERDLRLDFFRGLSLFFIFIDHIPGNIFSNLTLRSIAFSAAAGVFIFI